MENSLTNTILIVSEWERKEGKRTEENVGGKWKEKCLSQGQNVNETWERNLSEFPRNFLVRKSLKNKSSIDFNRELLLRLLTNTHITIFRPKKRASKILIFLSFSHATARTSLVRTELRQITTWNFHDNDNVTFSMRKWKRNTHFSLLCLTFGCGP